MFMIEILSLNKVVRTAVIYMYWIGSNSGNMRVINPSWLVINAQLLHAVEQAHIYKLRTDLSYPESLTIWVWLSASMVGVVKTNSSADNISPEDRELNQHSMDDTSKRSSTCHSSLVLVIWYCKASRDSDNISQGLYLVCNFTSTLGCLYLMSCFSLPLNLSVCILLKV